MEAEKQTALVPFITPTPGQIHLVVSHSSTPKRCCNSWPQSVCTSASSFWTAATLQYVHGCQAHPPLHADPVGIQPHSPLARFTCIQVLAMLKSTLALAPQEPLVIMDLLTTFLDEDLALPDARALLARSLDYIQGLSQHMPRW